MKPPGPTTSALLLTLRLTRTGSAHAVSRLALPLPLQCPGAVAV